MNPYRIAVRLSKLLLVYYVVAMLWALIRWCEESAWAWDLHRDRLPETRW